MTQKITIPYFPKGMKYTSPVVFIGAIALFVTQHPVWGSVLSLLGIVILTTTYVTEIDLEKKTIRDYLSLLFIPLNEERKRFDNADRIVITKGNYAQAVNTRAQSRQMNWSDYTGTLLLNNGTLDLLTNTDKKELITGLKPFADYLKIGIEDQTMREPYWIDITKY